MARMSDLLTEVRNIEKEGFASDAQRRAAFASGYKAKGKKGKKEDVELDEVLKHTHMVLGPDGKVIGMASSERGANDIAKNNLLKVKGRVVKLRKPMSSTRGDRLIGMLPADNLGEALDKKDEPKVKGIIKKLKKASDAHAGQASDLEKAINEDGHTDVASAVRQCKTIVEDATQMMSKLQGMSPEDSLPTWWTNKLAVASNNMNKMRDYLLVPSVSEETELDEAQKDIDFAVNALTKANIKHVAKQHPMKRSKIIVNVSRKDYKAAEKALGKEFSSQGDNIMLGISESAELDESKMKQLSMYIDDIAREMTKDKMMKPFASKFKADAMKSMNPKKSLEKVLPDYIAGKEIAKLLNMGIGEEKINEILPLVVRAAPKVAKAVSKINPSTIGNTAATVATGAQRAKDYISKKAKAVKKKITGEDVQVIEGYFPEAKSSTGYDLYHNDFSSAMQHAYDHAKKKFGITINKSEIDDKVATGPRKPTRGKTNSYRLKGDKGTVRVQVYNMGNKFELNMYKEELELTEKVSKDLAIKILSMNKNQKFAKISGDFVPEIYLSASDKEELKKEFGRLPRGLPSASSGIPVVDFINYALGLDNEIDTEGDGNAPKLYDYRKGKVIGKPRTVGDAAKIAGVRMESINLDEKKKLKSGAKFDFELFSDMKGAKEAEAELNKELHKAVKMKDKETAKKHMMKFQMKHQKFGATDTEPREVIDMVLNAIFENKQESIDPADVDITATAKDVENASKNIILQLRKVITLRGMKPVEFASGKEKVNPNIAQKALSIHQNLRRTDEKDAFQRKIAKSYKDLLNAVKGRK